MGNNTPLKDVNKNIEIAGEVRNIPPVLETGE